MSRLLRKLFKSKNKENMSGGMRTIASDQEFLGPSQKRNGFNKQSSVHKTNGRFIVVEEGGNSYLVEKEECQGDRDLRTNQNRSGDDTESSRADIGRFKEKASTWVPKVRGLPSFARPG